MSFQSTSQKFIDIKKWVLEEEMDIVTLIALACAK